MKIINILAQTAVNRFSAKRKIRRKTILRVVLCCFLIGIFVGTYEKTAIAISIGICIGLFASCYFYQKSILLLPLLTLLIFGLGFWRADSIPKQSPPDNIGQFATEDGTEVEIIGKVTEFPDKRYGRTKWVVDVVNIRSGTDEEQKWTSGKVLIQTSSELQINFNDTARFSGRLMVPFETEEFSYKKYLARQQIFAVMNYPHTEILEQGSGNTPKQVLYKLRQWFDAELKKQILPPESAFAGGILIGDRSGFSPVWEERFRISGLSHMLALSGYNITIIVITIFQFFRFLPKQARILITVIFLGAFVIFVGGGASIIRAAVMGVIGLFVVHSGREAEGGDLLLMASVIMVAWQPLILMYDPSFQLSVAGVVGLLIFAKPFTGIFRKKIGDGILTEILAATLAAQLGVLPLITFLFGEVSLVAPLANLIVSPVIPLAMLTSFLTIVLGGIWGFVGQVCGFIAWNIMHICLLVVKLASELPYAGISMQLELFGFVMLTVLIALLGLALRTYGEKT